MPYIIRIKTISLEHHNHLYVHFDLKIALTTLEGYNMHKFSGAKLFKLKLVPLICA